MYQLYIKTDSAFDGKKLIGEFSNIDDAHEKIEAEIAKDKDIKYVIEESTGSVNIYGDLISDVIEEN